ncbi:MAG: glycoside hydrolase family 3 C-terminal domain-containing protein [Spirochaetaceae bacterium]|jgi:beta-glucosidase|nr:glycoside hydrolase family 3 C-terminal domain-containing protein [Spirochaetaceae bacterium]
MSKKVTQKGYKVKWGVIIGGIAVVALVVNILMFGLFQTVLTNFFQPKVERSEAVVRASANLTEAIAEGGIVLLKNEGGVLPLSGERTRVNVFGWSSTNPVYGGTGSGGVDVSQATDFFGGLAAAGIEYNQTLVDFYRKFRAARPTVGMWAQDWTVPEPTMGDYDAAGIFANAKQFSNTAIIYIARSGGEGADLPKGLPNVPSNNEGNRFTEYTDDVDPNRHYLELSVRERAMVERVTKEFDNVVVLINGNNVFETRWVDEYGADSVVWIGGPGESGFKAVGNILAGKANPSGRTADTWLADLTQDPTYGNFGDFAYTDEGGYHFVNYVEGIYMGYRFYETFYLNNEAGYRAAVQYPFGYGLSYTAFDQQLGTIRKSGNTLSVDVTVTNTGGVAGKEVVQLYHTAPYHEGGIEKAHVVLTAFGKTGTLQPGAAQTITLTFKEEDLASFDAAGAGAYVLEAGDYEIKLMRNAHEVIARAVYRVENPVVYSGNGKRSSDMTEAARVFAFAENDIPYLSRANNFANYAQATAPAADRAMTEREKEAIKVQLIQNPNDQTPKAGVKGNLKLADMVGKSYDDPAWDALLDQLTIEEMNTLISLGGYQTKPVRSIDKPATIDIDGPQGLSTFMSSSYKGGAFPTAVVVASTWDTTLANARGTMVGNEALEMGVQGWYAPAMNTHRNAFAGRNFEYFSEDGFLSGKMAAAETAGAKSKGVYGYIKHFALNDQETNRIDKVCTWATEQTIREIYLKPFELSVKEGGAAAVMSSFNFIGGTWAGGCPELLTTVLRGEWGFRGMVLTDYFGGYGYMDADQAIYTGTDMMLSTLGTDGATLDESTTPTGRVHMRNSSKNILYTVANSNAMYSIDQRESMLQEVGGRVFRGGPLASLSGSSTQPWMLIAWGVDILIAALLVLLVVFKIRKYRRLFGSAGIRLTQEG